jgi:hypothetical protein
MMTMTSPRKRSTESRRGGLTNGSAGAPASDLIELSIRLKERLLYECYETKIAEE